MWFHNDSKRFLSILIDEKISNAYIYVYTSTGCELEWSERVDILQAYKLRALLPCRNRGPELRQSFMAIVAETFQNC